MNSTFAASAMIPQFAPDWAEVFGEDQYGIFAEFTIKAVRYVWRWIPPGEFLMGSPEAETGRWANEGPQHKVLVSRGYWMGETPVTHEQWVEIMGEHGNVSLEQALPVTQISWHKAQDFIIRLKQRVPGLNVGLPTEAQWEYACRAGTQGAFCINDSLCTQPDGLDPVLDQFGWFKSNSDGKLHPVKQKLANDWGLYDMHGNVFEWCLDGMREYSKIAQVNPIGPIEQGAFRVVRGGSWINLAQFCRAAYRFRIDPGCVWGYVGFRLSAGQEQAKPEGAERQMVPERRSRG